MKAFEGKVALVTGATAGIGKATALAFAREGAKVVFSGRREAEGRQVAEEIKRAGGTALFIPGDVSKESDVIALVQGAVKAFGRLDCAVNNAAIEGQQGPISDQSVENFDAVVSINLRGVWLSLKYEIPTILKSGGGAIVNMSSVGAQVGVPGSISYAATKGGIESMTRVAALEHATAGLRVNVIAPGPVQTDMLNRFFGSPEQLSAVMAAAVPMGRAGKAEEVADAALWLCSDRASFVTGQVITVDGGYTAR